MKEYEQDIKQLIDCINCTYEERSKTHEKCLNALTKEIEEPYLLGRASAILQAAKNNEEFAMVLNKLESHCTNGNNCTECVVRKYCNTYISQQRELANSAAFQMIDLFCGAGGLSLGFAQEGFTIALANDIEPCCIDTYSHNHPEIPRDRIVLGDIKDVVANLDNLLQGKRIDVVVGGPPCQGFSMANRQRLIDDPRNHLYKNYVEVVKLVQPQFFIMENVKGMLSVASQVKEDFSEAGYTCEYKVLNAKDFGVPQNRERLIYIGNRIGVDNEMIFDEINAYSQFLTPHVLADALYALRPLEASREKNSTDKGSMKSGYLIEKNHSDKTNHYITDINQGRNTPLVFNHKARYNNNRDIEIFGRLNQGDRSDDPKIADIMPYTRRNGIFKDKYYKLEESKACKTITAHMKYDCNMYIHPTQARGLTPREAARVQSFPDDYFFRGSYTKTYMQIGNSVPPLLGRAIATAIKQYLKNEVKL